jgi:hypothetical protein
MSCGTGRIFKGGNFDRKCSRDPGKSQENPNINFPPIFQPATPAGKDQPQKPFPINYITNPQQQKTRSFNLMEIPGSKSTVCNFQSNKFSTISQTIIPKAAKKKNCGKK